MTRWLAMLLLTAAVTACGSDAETGDDGGDGGDGDGLESDDGSGAANGSPDPSVCGAQIGPPTGACSAGAECTTSDGGCDFDAYCLEGSWANVRSCGAASCPREAPEAGSPCPDDGALCAWSVMNGCVANLECKAGQWTELDCF